jgi:diguanylate cyclase (GGDEF)-like protein
MKLKIKILLLTVGTFLLGGYSIAATGILKVSTMSKNSARTNMNLLVSNFAEELNSSLLQIEDATEFVENISYRYMESTDKLKTDPAYRQSYQDDLLSSFDAITDRNSGNAEEVGRTPGACAYYMVFNPAITDNQEGFFYVKEKGATTYKEHEVTKIEDYDASEDKHVYWWTQATSDTYNPEHKAMWLDPYQNDNIGRELISYVIPLWSKDNKDLIGIIGMDMDFDYIRSQTKEITVFKTGTAILENDDGSIAYMKGRRETLTTGTSERPVITITQNADIYNSNKTSGDQLIFYTIDGVEKGLSFTSLRNGMKLYLVAPTKEIYQEEKNSVIEIASLMLVTIGVLILISTFIISYWTKPIQALNEATKEISDDNLNIPELEVKSHDEIGELTHSFNKMADQLKKKDERLQEMIYTDPMTKVYNKGAYELRVKQLSLDIEAKRAFFTLIMCDINNLKYINDTYGHEAGDENINLTAKTLLQIFDKHDIFRIGGDEFVIILQDTNIHQIKDKLDDLVKYSYQPSTDPEKPYHTVSFSLGYTQIKEEDTSYSEIFARAEKSMYDVKDRIHKGR